MMDLQMVEVKEEAVVEEREREEGEGILRLKDMKIQEMVVVYHLIVVLLGEETKVKQV